ncbi:putative general repressor of transcription-like protein [Phaeoacremonium minimum UCRPA7]|uniref:Putative general repressor of transcription-like protein n=1 Tax=Phaeoacremonium minimum (strain UCR-PA7) TaxID=1286976 RepID=R8BI47_PHAM7|nr:putative general repressor of transcription-like protein [Phaeoacremonium minimum UCRPA7]EON99010.1 putative general repressor of transcription-like protein [Phaeoacremonium minimum UCRPA7]
MRAEKISKRDPVKVRRDILDAPIISSPVPAGRQAKGVDEWDFLPPLPEIIDAVNQFTRLYFQLGFIPKQLFPERLKKDHRSVSVFLLLSILSISARFTPSIVLRYGDGMKAADIFMERASVVALSELYREPSLERCQAFYLLSIAQQGSGWKNRSFINLGIAMRMAGLMRLHREETYALKSPTKELIVRAESARRTFWMLHSQDNLHSGPSSPVSLAASDITALLPGNEEDFAKGREPKSRAALEDTPPAIENPRLISDPNRSLFATLIQTHYFWGRISRRAVSHDSSSRPWETMSDYAKIQKSLDTWEQGLPRDHVWSSFALKGYKTEGQDLAYLAVTMVIRLCNIVIRKAYLRYMIFPDQSEPNLRAFWSNMALEMFKNVRELYEQIDTQFIDRAPDEHLGAQMASAPTRPLFKMGQ